MLPLLATALLAASGTPTPEARPKCAVTKEFIGTAPSDIIQQQFEGHFQMPLNRVECKDNGLCYQTWGKDCKKASE